MCCVRPCPPCAPRDLSRGLESDARPQGARLGRHDASYLPARGRECQGVCCAGRQKERTDISGVGASSIHVEGIRGARCRTDRAPSALNVHCWLAKYSPPAGYRSRFGASLSLLFKFVGSRCVPRTRKISKRLSSPVLFCLHTLRNRIPYHVIFGHPDTFLRGFYSPRTLLTRFTYHNAALSTSTHSSHRRILYAVDILLIPSPL